ncbi:hypothetical protein QRZ34_27365 [Klebsiella michiganensis]|nr:hypothetical protein [Klebsiella michiganensis]MDL4454758.1 hypothetical protein [Klebsiella michiganensis]
MITSNIGAVKNILTLQELLVLLRKSSAISNVANGIYVESEITEVGKWLAAYAENKVEILSTIAAELEGFLSFSKIMISRHQVSFSTIASASRYA